VTSDCATSAYYSELFGYVKSKGGVAKVVLNPGTKTGECYMTSSDIIVTFEDEYDKYIGWQPDGWETRYGPDRFWHLVINTPSSSLPQAISLSKSRNVGWIYVTDDNGGNPWDSLPSYWDQLLTFAGAQ
jgi:hypothetical protein